MLMAGTNSSKNKTREVTSLLQSNRIENGKSAKSRTEKN